MMVAKMKIQSYTNQFISTFRSLAPEASLRRATVCFAAVVLAHTGHGLTQSILDNAVVVEEFTFNDVSGTGFESLSNSANPGNSFDTDTDTADVATNGAGQLNASLKSNDGFGSNYIDLTPVDSGLLYAWMELTWNFQSTLDTIENDEIRLSLINNAARGTEVTAQWELLRGDDNRLTLGGTANGTGASTITPVELNGGSLSQGATFTAVVEANFDDAVYSVHYSNDAGANYTVVGSGSLDPSRGVSSLRLVLNNDLSNDNVLIDRLVVATAVPEPAHFGGIVAFIGLLRVALRRRVRQSLSSAG